MHRFNGQERLCASRNETLSVVINSVEDHREVQPCRNVVRKQTSLTPFDRVDGQGIIGVARCFPLRFVSVSALLCRISSSQNRVTLSRHML